MAKKKKKTGFAAYPENINRNGRPKTGEAMSDVIREYLDGADGSNKTERKKNLAKKLYDMAMDGNITAIKELLDRVDGKALQNISAKIERDGISALSADEVSALLDVKDE